MDDAIDGQHDSLYTHEASRHTFPSPKSKCYSGLKFADAARITLPYRDGQAG